MSRPAQRLEPTHGPRNLREQASTRWAPAPAGQERFPTAELGSPGNSLELKELPSDDEAEELQLPAPPGGGGAPGGWAAGGQQPRWWGGGRKC